MHAYCAHVGSRSHNACIHTYNRAQGKATKDSLREGIDALVERANYCMVHFTARNGMYVCDSCVCMYVYVCM